MAVVEVGGSVSIPTTRNKLKHLIYSLNNIEK